MEYMFAFIVRYDICIKLEAFITVCILLCIFCKSLIKNTGHNIIYLHKQKIDVPL